LGANILERDGSKGEPSFSLTEIRKVPRGRIMTKELDKALREMLAWWTSETQEFRYLVVDLLSGLPGSDEIAEYYMVHETENNCGWKEIDLLAKLFLAIENKDDVEKVSKRLLKESMRYAEELRD
jgi:3-methyladenine DNA glycosylase AlkD